MVSTGDHHPQKNACTGACRIGRDISLNRRDFCTALGGAGFLFASGCSSPKKIIRSSPPNIVLMVMDTVHARNCSGWGYKRQTTTHLDAFMQSAT